MGIRTDEPRWTAYAGCSLQSALTFLAAVAFSLIVHEMGHACAIRLTGGRVAGVDVALLPSPSGRTYSLYPFVEAPRQPEVTHAGGALANLGLGAAALLTWLPRRSRHPAFPAWLVMANLGAVTTNLMGYGVTGSRGGYVDLHVVASGLGLSPAAGRWVAAALGFPAAAAVGCWFLWAVLRCSPLPSSTPAERLRLLLWCAWAPVAGVGGFWTLAATRTAWSWPRVALVLCLLAASAAACWIVAAVSIGRRMPPGGPGREPGGWRSLLGAAALAALGVMAVRAVDARLDPDRRPTPEGLARWVDRAPRSERRLRLATHWSVRLGRLDEGLRYAERAVEVAPASAGALFDLAAMRHGLGHHREALELLDRAADLRPDLEALPAKRGQVQEALGLYADAARSWRLYAEMEQASEPIAEARDRHVRLALDRARRLEEKAAAP